MGVYAPLYGYGFGYGYHPYCRHFSTNYRNWGTGEHYLDVRNYSHGIYTGPGSTGHGFHSGPRMLGESNGFGRTTGGFHSAGDFGRSSGGFHSSGSLGGHSGGFSGCGFGDGIHGR